MKKTTQSSNFIKIGLTIGFIGGVTTTMTTPIFTHAETSESISQEKNKVDHLIEQLDEKMKKAQKKITKMQKDYERTKAQIVEINKESVETQERIDSREGIIGKRLSALQSDDSVINPYVDVLLEAKSFTDLVDRVYSVTTLISADQELLNEQKSDAELIKEKKRELEKKQAEQESQFQKLQEEYEQIENQKVEQEALSLQLATKLDKAKAKEAKAEQEKAKQLKELQKQSFNKDNKIEKITSDTFATNQKTSKKAKAIIDEASKYLGWQYTWGGASPKTSFDCSGLTSWSFKQAGISLPRTAAQQYLATERIDMKDAKPGDLVFFSYGSGIAHVGIYVGDGKMLDAQNNGIVVEKLAGYWEQYIAGFGRVNGVN